MQIIKLYEVFFTMGVCFTSLNLIILALCLWVLRANQGACKRHQKPWSARQRPRKPDTTAWYPSTPEKLKGATICPRCKGTMCKGGLTTILCHHPGPCLNCGNRCPDCEGLGMVWTELSVLAAQDAPAPEKDGA